jgi:hypothetical protein
MSASRERLAALERRIWRLAHLLTGDAGAASALVDRVLDAQPDPGALEAYKLDRLIIQQARGMAGMSGPREPAPLPPGENDVAHRTLATALTMPRQALESWVLARIDLLDELHCARAMDCSKTALKNHLGAADEQMRARLGGKATEAIDALRSYADALDPGPIIAAHRFQRKKERNRRRLIIAGVATILGLAALLAILKGLVHGP